MSLVLYRKYRSQTFDELIGQEHVASILKNAVSQKQVSHAYLLYGPRGLGKTSTARILAKAVNCLQLKPNGNPCGKCENCVAIQEGRFLDLIEIDAASNRGIEDVRQLKERIEFSPTEGEFKVYIIDEVHMLTTEAFNALLKTLEEPPSHAILILATTEIHKVPATIMSRCQRFDFRLGTDAEVRTVIESVLNKEGVKAEDGAIDLIIENARGSYRDALSLLDVVVSGQIESDNPKNITEEEVRVVLGLADSTMVYFFLEKIVRGDGAKALDLVQELAQKGVNLGQFVKYVLSVLRVILIGGLKGDVNYEEYSFAKKLDREKTLKLINLFVEAERSLKDAVVPTLPLEILVADAMEFFGSEKSEAAGVGDNGEGSGEEGGKKSSEAKADGKEKKSSGSSKKEKSEIKAETSKSISLSAKQLQEKWNQVLKELKPFNGHLYAFMGRARIDSLKDGVLRLGVAFDFHKDRMESAKSRAAVSKVFEQVFGCPIKLECYVDESIRGNVSPAAEVVVLDEIEAPPKRSKDVISVSSSSEKTNIYDSVAEVFGDDLVSS